MWQADLSGGLALVFGAEGKGVRPLVRRACDATIAIPLAGQVESLNVSVAAALLLYEAGAPARVAEPTLYLFDGYNLLHAGDFADERELDDALASFVALQGARGVLVFDGAGADRELGPLAVRFAPHADALLERLAAEHRDTEEVCLVSSDFAVRGTSGQEVQKRSLARRSSLDLEHAAARRVARLAAASTRSTPRRASGSSGCAAGDSLDTNICS